MYKVVFICIGKLEVVYCQKIDYHTMPLFVILKDIVKNPSVVSAYPIVGEHHSFERFQNTEELALSYQEIKLIEKLKEVPKRGEVFRIHRREEEQDG